MKASNFFVLALLPFLTYCSPDYVDTPLTSRTWEVNTVEERNNLKWKNAESDYPISTIRFFKDKSLELTYQDDTTTYFGDWTDYYQNSNCSGDDCNPVHLLVINLYHESPLPTVFDITRLSSNKLTMVSQEPDDRLRMKLTP